MFLAQIYTYNYWYISSKTKIAMCASSLCLPDRWNVGLLRKLRFHQPKLGCFPRIRGAKMCRLIDVLPLKIGRWCCFFSRGKNKKKQTRDLSGNRAKPETAEGFKLGGSADIWWRCSPLLGHTKGSWSHTSRINEEEDKGWWLVGLHAKYVGPINKRKSCQWPEMRMWSEVICTRLANAELANKLAERLERKKHESGGCYQ